MKLVNTYFSKTLPVGACWCFDHGRYVLVTLWAPFNSATSSDHPKITSRHQCENCLKMATEHWSNTFGCFWYLHVSLWNKHASCAISLNPLSLNLLELFEFWMIWALFHCDCDHQTWGCHVGDARLGGIRIFDTRVKIQHDAQWSVLTWASIFWRARHQRENPYCDHQTVIIRQTKTLHKRFHLTNCKLEMSEARTYQLRLKILFPSSSSGLLITVDAASAPIFVVDWLVPDLQNIHCDEKVLLKTKNQNPFSVSSAAKLSFLLVGSVWALLQTCHKDQSRRITFGHNKKLAVALILCCDLWSWACNCHRWLHAVQPNRKLEHMEHVRSLTLLCCYTNLVMGEPDTKGCSQWTDNWTPKQNRIFFRKRLLSLIEFSVSCSRDVPADHMLFCLKLRAKSKLSHTNTTNLGRWFPVSPRENVCSTGNAKLLSLVLPTQIMKTWFEKQKCFRFVVKCIFSWQNQEIELQWEKMDLVEPSIQATRNHC